MLERLFSLAGMVVLPCWILIAAAPRWRWSQRLATFVAPLMIAALYGWLLFSHAAPKGAGFQTLAQVMVLFSSPYDAARLVISLWIVLPCLLLTFLFGPTGLVLYLLLKLVMRRSVGAVDEVTI
jgi:hypothetical protein